MNNFCESLKRAPNEDNKYQKERYEVVNKQTAETR